MPLEIAAQMDPIDRIDIRGDSTFAILLEAQKRMNRLLQSIIYGGLGFVLGLLVMQLMVRVRLF